MTALYIISFILLVVATFALLKLTPEQINKDINELWSKQQTLKDQALMARGKKRKNRLILELERMRRALQETGKEKQFSLACAAALLLMVAGCIVAIAIDNMFLIPVLAVAFALIPFAYLTKTIAIFETQVRQELETALSIITTSYIRSDNLVSAVQENLSYLKPPIKGIFEEFIAEATIISPDISEKLIIFKCANLSRVQVQKVGKGCKKRKVKKTALKNRKSLVKQGFLA